MVEKTLEQQMDDLVGPFNFPGVLKQNFMQHVFKFFVYFDGGLSEAEESAYFKVRLILFTVSFLDIPTSSCCFLESIQKRTHPR